ncbi:MAG: DUF5025 domain-containing protein [Dysgonamonadaceae bacterium]|jgi:hypothetical protein|nr:DUF5025 domain-containing protein [Dysgonamonadaceae bacterium]
MKTRIIKLIGYTIIVLCILASCDNGEGFTYEPYIRGQDWSWGYMHGAVERPLTGEKISVSHVQHPSLKGRQGHRYMLLHRPDIEKEGLFRYMSFCFNDKEAYNYDVNKRTKDMLPSLSILRLTLVNNFLEGTILKIEDGDLFVDLDGGGFDHNFNSSISIEFYDNADYVDHVAMKPLRYVPDKNNPFLVHLDIVEPYTGYTPAVVLEGRLEGVLYREDNPEDYMIVDISFGM